MNLRSELHGLLGKPVTIEYWTGSRSDGRLVGIVGPPSVIVETDDGERVTYAISCLNSIEAALPERVS